MSNVVSLAKVGRPLRRLRAHCVRTLLSIALGCAGAVVSAAPLDALMSVDPARDADRGYVEVGADLVNEVVDVFRVRDETDTQRGIGDYAGGHLRLGAWATSRLWLEGAVWRRSITYGPDKPRMDTHQVALQYLLTDPAAVASGRPGIAVRLGYWSDRSALLRKSTPTRLTISDAIITVDEVSVSNARDRQLQADIIGTMELSPSVTMNAFVGIGRSRVTIGGVDVRRGNLSATNSGGCSDTVRLGSAEASGLINVDGEACYRATFTQIGANIRWAATDRWTLTGGYTLQRLSRDRLDDIIESRGGESVDVAHTLIGQASYRLAPRIDVFGRGQLMSSPFLGEVPFLYNSITASRFGRTYGIVTFGIIASF